MARFIKEMISLWDVVGTYPAISSHKNKRPERVGKKTLTGKPEWCVVPMEAMEGVVRVFEHGFKKYGNTRTWLPGIRFSLLFSAICRHLFDWFFFGSDKDKGSGQHPLCSVIANALMLLTFIDNPKFDDRRCVYTDKPMSREAIYGTMVSELEEATKESKGKGGQYDYTKKS